MSFRSLVLRRVGLLGLSAALVLVAVPACSSSDDAIATEGSNVERTADDDDAPLDGSTGRDGGSEAAAGETTITEILGTLTGTCGLVRQLLTSKNSALITDNLVFVDGEKYEKSALSQGGQHMFDTPNAGGSSTESEVISYEVLHFCEGASLLKTETEVAYQPGTSGAITDILVEIDGKKVGVSVTRSYKPSNQTYDDAQVKALLDKKLAGVQESSARVASSDKWVKQILHVFTANRAATEAVERVFPTVAQATRGDTIVLVTETQGGGFVYCRPTPPLGSECP